MATAYELINGTERPLDLVITKDAIRIDGLQLRDYPLLLRLGGGKK